ncbi:hypothetical protein P8452_61880 [Trifolium repens]|nr:hypothetical protein P8452_61880 [Trifolium repens]
MLLNQELHEAGSTMFWLPGSRIPDWIINLQELTEIDAARNWRCKDGRIPKTWRFDPLTSQTTWSPYLFIVSLNYKLCTLKTGFWKNEVIDLEG